MSRLVIFQLIVVPHFPSSLHYLDTIIVILSPPNTPSSSKLPLTPHHPIVSTTEAWELRAVLLLWLALLLTVPFSLTALSSPTDEVNACTLDSRTLARLFPKLTTGIAQRVALLCLPFLYRPGNEGVYGALVLARLFSRNDAVSGLSGFLDWAGVEIVDGDRDGEVNLVASTLEFMAILPTLLSPKHLPQIQMFMEDTLLPHLTGSRTAASSGLIRKLVVKAKGRWWMTQIRALQAAGQGGQSESKRYQSIMYRRPRWHRRTAGRSHERLR